MSSHARPTTQCTTAPSSHHGLSLTGHPGNFLQASLDQLTFDVTLLSIPLVLCSQIPHLSFPMAVQSSLPNSNWVPLLSLQFIYLTLD
ncbi:hypothetical protein CHARACLAT_032342 [Characodon lateralis]|uniref:Uncharacterized protein n=1 Tax=Characodon lateralis TaxID=208331 RepID=A0ABU7E5M9_9TELE|nr:hypothetical protein [Characodon lateralis]